MRREKLIQELILILCTLLPIIYLAVNWNLLPESMPIHFDAHGQPNGYGSRYVYVWMPVGLYFLMLVLPKIDPRKANYAVFEGSYFKLRLIMAIRASAGYFGGGTDRLFLCDISECRG